MGTKEKIIAKISAVEDENYLKDILGLLNAVEETQAVYQLSAAERMAVEDGLQDVAAGRTYTQKDMNALTQRWLQGK